jgi:hypothetical protein
VGGIPYGSNNEEIYLTTCEVVGTPEEMPTPAPIVWGTQVLMFYFSTLEMYTKNKAGLSITCLY